MATLDDLIRFKGPGQVSFSDANTLLSSANDRTMEAVKGLQKAVGETVDDVESNVLAKAQQVVDSYTLADYDNKDGLAMDEMKAKLEQLGNDTGMLDSGITHNYIKAREKELVQDKISRTELFKTGLELEGTQREQIQKAKTAKIAEAAQATRFLSKMGSDINGQIEAFRAENGADAPLPDHLVTANAELHKRKIVYEDAYGDILNDSAASQNLYDAVFNTENLQERERLVNDSWVQKNVGAAQMIQLRQNEEERKQALFNANSIEGQKAKLTENMSEGSPLALALNIDPTTGERTVNAALLNKNVEAKLGLIASEFNNAIEINPARYQEKISWKDKFGDNEQEVRRAFNSAVNDYQSKTGTKLTARQVNLLFNSVGTQGIDSSANPLFDMGQYTGFAKDANFFDSTRNMIYQGIPKALQNIEQYEKEALGSSYRKYFADLASDAATLNMSPEDFFMNTMGITPKNGYFNFLPETVKTRILNSENGAAAENITNAANPATTKQNAPATQQPAPAKNTPVVPAKNTVPKTDVDVAVEASNKATEDLKRKQWQANNGAPGSVNKNPAGVYDSRYPQMKGMTLAGKAIDYAFWNEQSRDFVPSKKTAAYYRERGTPVLKNGVSMGRIKFTDKSKVNSRYTTQDLARDLGVNKGFLDFVIKAQGVKPETLSKGKLAEIMALNYASAVKNKKIPITSLNYYSKKK